jgi:RNA polymerase sigma factor (sigma-70 family)
MESYARYGPALLRKAERLLQNRDDALDVVQGLFTDLLAEGGEEPDFPYLYRAVTNRCLGRMRDEKNRRRLLERQAPALRGPVRTTFDEVVVGLDVLARLVDKLDAETCELVVMHFWDDMSQGEIAELTGVSRKTIVRRMAHVREQINSILESEVSR